MHPENLFTLYWEPSLPVIVYWKLGCQTRTFFSLKYDDNLTKTEVKN